MSKPKYDKFYTKKEVVDMCIDFLGCVDSFDCIIEPSVGAGIFIKNFDEKSVYGFDIEPETTETRAVITKADFLNIPVEQLNKGANILVLGNPPFGRQNSLAIKFFNHCSNISNVNWIAFILPKSFRKQSIQSKLNPFFHLEREMEIPEDAFEYKDQTYNIPCVFQMWIRKSERRPQTQTERLNSIHLEFVKLSNHIPNFLISIRRVGFYAGKAKRYENENAQSHYFLSATNVDIANQVIEYLNGIRWEFNNSVGPRSISKQEFIRELNRYFTSLNSD
jgi:hypothetical protein